MANLNRPFGLKPVRYLSGAPYNGAVESFHVPSTNINNIFLGDPVILAGGGNTAVSQDFPPATIPDIAVSTIPSAGLATLTYPQYIMGSFVGRLPATRESNIYRPGGTEAVLMCTVDPNLIYQVQDNGAIAAGLGAAVIGFNGNLIAGTGSTASGQSGYMLDAGTIQAPGVSLNLQVTIYKLANLQNNDPNSPYAIWEVVLNWHPFSAPAIGI